MKFFGINLANMVELLLPLKFLLYATVMVIFILFCKFLILAVFGSNFDCAAAYQKKFIHREGGEGYFPPFHKNVFLKISSLLPPPA